MAKKRNVYAKESISDLKHEISSLVEFLETINLEALTDEINWKVTQKGVIPSITATIEQIIKTSLITLTDCLDMLLVIHKMEGMSAYIVENTGVLKKKLDEINDYYRIRPASGLVHRFLSHNTPQGKDKHGNQKPDRVLSFLVATSYQQINDRSQIMKKVAEALPRITELDSLREEVELRGGYDVPDSLAAWDVA